MKITMIQQLTDTFEGDAALFSRTIPSIKSRWNVPDKRHLADFAPTIILKAKDFATEITIFNAKEKSMASEAELSHEYIANNKAVRQILLERGIRPETLTPDEDVKKVEPRLISKQKTSLRNQEGLEQ